MEKLFEQIRSIALAAHSLEVIYCARKGAIEMTELRLDLEVNEGYRVDYLKAGKIYRWSLRSYSPLMRR